MTNPFVTKALSLPGVVAVWAQSRDGSAWQDDGALDLDLTATGAVWETAGGPGDALPGYWHMDGVDDTLLRPSGDDSALDLGAADGWHWLLVVVRRHADTTSFGPSVTKGDNTYALRGTAGGSGTHGQEIRGGTGGNVTNAQGNMLPLDLWQMVAGVQDQGAGELRLYGSGGSSSTADIAYAMALAATNSRSGTVGTNSNARFSVGVQDNDGTLRRWYAIDVAAVVVGDGDIPTLAQIEELRQAVFEEPSAFDPANLQATVDGDTVSLSWDASPLVPA